jgi:cytochrome c oxidase subunit 2
MIKLLVVLVVVLGVIAVAQLARVYEITSELRNKREEEISHANNRFNAGMMLVFMVLFFGFFAYLAIAYGGELLPVSASAHGVEVDKLFTANWILITAIFVITNGLLFWFASKYYFRADNRATFFPHSNKLELVWTISPSIVLFFFIFFGMQTWGDITETASDDAIVIEIYSKQFDWTARYAGIDGQVGQSSFNLISSTNPLGLITKKVVSEKIEELNQTIEDLALRLEEVVMGENLHHEMLAKLDRLKRHRIRVIDISNGDSKFTDFVSANDDQIVKGEFHIPIGKEIKFVFRSQDVIHSAFMPHFRIQMNTVPGMTTTFKMTPTITTDSMRVITGKENFTYLLFCNKVCGAAHFNMKMEIVVDTEEDYALWLQEQKVFAEVTPANEENKLAKN